MNRIVRFEMADHVVSLNRSRAVPESDVKRAQTTIVKDRAAIEDLVDARYVTHRIDDAEFDRAKSKLEDRIHQHEMVLAAGSADHAVALLAMTLGEIDQWWENEPMSAQRALLRSAIEKVVLHPAKQRGGNVFDPSRVEIVWKATATA
jgi:hypothetical protein